MANDKDRMTVDQALENVRDIAWADRIDGETVRVLGREVERLQAILACVPWKAYCNDVVKPDPSSPSLADAVVLPLTRGELTFLRAVVSEACDKACSFDPHKYRELCQKLLLVGTQVRGKL